VPLPKSDNPEYIQSNLDIYDFTIQQEDIDTLDALDEGDSGAIVQAVDNDSI
jgi:diketogulonate reductase-like aldo/keto reductase